MAQGEQPLTNVLDTFEHVVVLMLENRSFDNLLGYLYSREYPVPPGKRFEGLDGSNFSNPIPAPWQFKDKNGAPVTEVLATPISDLDLTKFSPPYPDPGEDYPHVNTQLFNPNNPAPYNKPPYNLPASVPTPKMDGFVSDYIQNYIHTEFPNKTPPSPETFYDSYKYVMESYSPADIPVLSGLAREFAVFDHWFCSVPSETICNRNFWHAGTSWGHVINPGPGDDPGDESNQLNTIGWVLDTASETLFSQLARLAPPVSWKLYSDNKIPLPEGGTLSLPITPLLHLFDFLQFDFDSRDKFDTLEGFKNDCAKGQLPAYSFMEPNFFTPHNDMHPSTPGERVDGSQKVGSVLLGEALVWDIYNAIFTSPSLWDNTLLIITFDEHGGCYDHVSPPGQYGPQVVAPAAIAAPPRLSLLQRKWDGFDFNRLGVRVPMIMISPYIKKNTIVNDPMSHTSFLRTVHEKWGGGSLSAREDASPRFHDTGLLWPTLQRQKISEMPTFPQPVIQPDDTDYSKAVMSHLAQAIMSLFTELSAEALDRPSKEIKTQADAAAYLDDAVQTAKVKLGQGPALKGQLNERDWAPLYRAIAEELNKKKSVLP
jgi:phospholipase C